MNKPLKLPENGFEVLASDGGGKITFQALKDYAENADKDELAGQLIQQEMRIEHLLEHGNEQAGRLIKSDTVLRQAKTAINDLMSCNEISKIADVRGEDAIKAIDALLGGKDDV